MGNEVDRSYRHRIYVGKDGQYYLRYFQAGRWVSTGDPRGYATIQEAKDTAYRYESP